MAIPASSARPASSPRPAADRLPNEAPGMESPVPSSAPGRLFGSDVVADTLRRLDIPFIALTPGASFRGLHDSLVNHLGNERPQMLLCLHEEHAIAIAHGYAKATGRPLAAAIHSNVGLFHATMAIFNAWCDRMPVLIIGATGPVDAAKRRPWIDWIHTSRDQGAVVRGYVKWDDQPASPAAAREALLRGAWLARTAPQAPVYITLDAALQEEPLAEPLPPIDESRFLPRLAARPNGEEVDGAARLLASAKRPAILIGRVSRSEQAWANRVALAERLGAAVVTDLKVGAGFPTDHPLHRGVPGLRLDQEAQQALRGADVILSLDWVDLAGALRNAGDGAWPTSKIIQASLDHVIHNGWSMDHQALPPVDLMLAADPDAVVEALLRALAAGKPSIKPAGRPAEETAPAAGGPLTVRTLAMALRRAAGGRAVTLAHLPLSWNGADWPFLHPLDFLGSDGGGGIGAGPGLSVGAALALKDSGRLVAGVCGDGDFLMGATALWTAVHYRLPLLLVVANNRSYFNDELHQERVALARGRPVENKWIGQAIRDPDLDLAGLARSQGASGFGPVNKAEDLAAVFAAAIAAVEAGAVAVVDVRVEPEGEALAVIEKRGG